MADYNLDALGWQQFERIAQAVLKAAVSPAIEATAGKGDQGRDAWFDGPLEYPVKGRLTEGPFLFQMKFVQHANAPGAKPAPGVKAAVAAEVERLSEHSLSSIWKPPSHYTLVTNSPLGKALRDDIASEVRKVIPAATVICWGSSDLDALLDGHPQIRLSHPEILGIRDVDALLSKVVNADVIQRSRIEIQLAVDLAKVFVPTRAYQMTLSTLAKHNFAVLAGPPEVGKTAIARIAALSRLSTGWQALELTDSREFFSLYDPQVRQVFVADDAFGSTEYTPERAQQWARDMERILRSTDRLHRIIFTSRTGPLNEALRVLNFQGGARHFPKPSKVLVNASALTLEERALMLYRHAKAAGFSSEVNQFIRENALTIVSNTEFTPLRVERLVSDDLAQVMSLAAGERQAALREAVERGLREPTKAMKTSFRGLSPEHRRALVAMLDTSPVLVRKDELVDALRRHSTGEGKYKPEEVVDSLDEHFVRIESPFGHA
jgi:hypothetical protein